jgi:hypothetical protein
MKFDDTPSLTPSQWAEIDRSLRSGNKSKAVSTFRQITGVSADKALELVTVREKSLPKGGGGMEFF